MARIPIINLANDKDLIPIFKAGEQLMGFIPNDGLTMAHRPDILKSFLGLVQSIYAPGEVADDLKRMIGLITSSVSGCQYCQAHAANAANDKGANQEKIKAVWDFETSTLFSPKEKIALRVAQRSAMIPNAVSDDDFTELKKHFSTNQIIEIVAVISMYGFLNRWNATLQTDLEEKPAKFINKLNDV